VGVAFGCADGIVTEEFLDVAYVRAVFQQVRGKGVAKTVDGRAFVYAGGAQRILADVLGAAYRKVVASLCAGEYPCLDVECRVIVLDKMADAIRKQGVAFLSSFPGRDSNGFAGKVYVLFF